MPRHYHDDRYGNASSSYSRRRSRSRSPMRDRSDAYYSGRNTSSNYGSSSGFKSSDRSVRNDPTDRVILQNLSYLTTVSKIEDALFFMKSPYASVEVIYDKQTNAPKGFGFIQFASVEDAIAFVDRFFPGFELDDRKVFVNFARPPRADYVQQEEAVNWDCPLCGTMNFSHRRQCFSCKTDRPLSATIQDRYKINSGEDDASDIPFQALVIRGLDTLTTDERLFEAFAKISPVLCARLVKDASTNASLGFGFVEYDSVASAAFVLQYLAADPSFKVDRRSITVAYARSTSFAMTPESTLKYWDDSAYATRFPPQGLVAGFDPAVTAAPAVAPAPAVASDKKKMESDLNAFFADIDDLVNSGSTPPNVAEEDHASSHAHPSVGPVLPSEMHAETDAVPPPPPPRRTEPCMNLKAGVSKQTERKPESVMQGERKPVVDKKLQEQMDRWKTKQTEMVEDEESEESEYEDPPVPIPKDEDFADFNISACLLCQRRFKSNDDLKRHQALSDLHKNNMKAHLDRFYAEHNMKPRPFQPSSSYGSNNNNNNMRPKKSAPRKGKRPADDKFLSMDEAVKMWEEQQHGEKNPDALPEPLKKSVGNKLLEKMGWKEGQGLGKEETGIASAIKTEAYTPGAGIGAGIAMSSTDKAALAMGDYKSRGRELARMRFEELNK